MKALGDWFVMSRFIAAGCLLLCLGIVPYSMAQNTEDRARIVRMEKDVHGYADDVQPAPSLMSKKLKKFSAKSRRVANPQYLVYYVHWQPPSEGLSEGATLEFRYRQERSDDVQALRITYPFLVKSRRKATFEISPKAFKHAGDVKAWQVRLIHNKRVLDQRQSENWR